MMLILNDIFIALRVILNFLKSPLTIVGSVYFVPTKKGQDYIKSCMDQMSRVEGRQGFAI